MAVSTETHLGHAATLVNRSHIQCDWQHGDNVTAIHFDRPRGGEIIIAPSMYRLPFSQVTGIVQRRDPEVVCRSVCVSWHKLGQERWLGAE